ncbi:MAG: acetamidase/formamidase family protein [Rubrobacteraceae bacterium]|uniref:acetamidase/formamidase family protein n=1 Tax=Rubrobacter naiadicus TaxID=1392641 RepID=UPI0023608C62|nr:acetamidase/formamidase family protein [Rubrobacter naiadicus]MBX6764210.1 acetamidase/formamidase family protein [Rubrobacteraceae bacterium]
MPEEHVISIDPSKQLADEPHTGHNRWHEDLEPVVEVEPGDIVIYETRDAFDGQLNPASTAEDVGRLDLGPVHPLTGPVYVKGAEPGDLLEVKALAIEPDPWDQWGYTVEVPGFGFLRDEFTEPYIIHWRLNGTEYAESEQLPGVRLRYNPHLASLGLAPSAELRRTITEREAAVASRGGFALPPDPAGAVPGGRIAEEGLRTIPPREIAGNLDIKQLSPGVTVLIPVYREGALVSTGDIHYAQGDCEACGTGIEMRSRVHLRFFVHKGEAERRGIRDLRFYRDDYFTAPELAAPRRFYATTGIGVSRDGESTGEDITLAAKNALLNMIEHLGERGYDRQQAYALCSVAVDLRISQTVDVPNMLVSALLPLDIFV